MAGLTFKSLRKSFGTSTVLHDVSLTIEDGEFVVFVGPSGCGKSTMLRCIAGLEDITSGELRIGDRLVNDVPPAKRDIAMVFQSYALYPHMTVAKNMGFGLKLAGASRSQVDEAVGDAAQTLQIQHLLERKPKALSGGQRQRVAIGRAIVQTPGVFLFDEPLSNLDAALRVQMRVEIARLHRELNTTMVYVTHDQVEAMTLASRIVVFNGGRIEQVGTPMDLYHRPINLFVAGFIGSPTMNFLNVELEQVDASGASVRLSGGEALDTHAHIDLPAQQARAKLVLGVRPEHLEVTPEGTLNSFRGEVLTAEHLGDVTYLHVQVPGATQTVIVRIDGDHSAPKRGDRVHLGAPAHRFHLFNPDGPAYANAV